jgi:hypothetical protein
MESSGKPVHSQASSGHGALDRRSFVRRGAVLGVSLTALPAFLAACGGSDEAQQSVAQVNGRKKTLDRFDFSLPIPVEDSQHATWYVNKMIFGPQEGIDVQLHSATSATDFLKRVATGDYLAAHPSPFVLTTLIDSGLPVKAYFGMMAKNIFGFAVKESSPIRTLRDIEGKDVATLGVGFEVIWNPGLKRVGVDTGRVKYVNVGLGGARLNALQSDKTAAMVTWDPTS